MRERIPGPLPPDDRSLLANLIRPYLTDRPVLCNSAQIKSLRRILRHLERSYVKRIGPAGLFKAGLARPPVVGQGPVEVQAGVLLLRYLSDQVGGIGRAVHIEVHAPRVEAHQLVDLVGKRGTVQVLW